MGHQSRIAGFRIAGDPGPLQELVRLWGAAEDIPLPPPRSGALSARHCVERGIWEFSACASADVPPELEIETDNLEAEAARLEERGARRIGHLRERMWLLQAPGGERLRVLAANTAPQASGVHWD